MKKISNNYSQRGAVSLFIVVFAALLITIVTVSFVRIMLQDQNQASTTDLSQSAYDSAQAGVEDAKRALLKYQDICNSGGDCATAASNINSPTCNVAVETLKDVADAAAKSRPGEVNVQTGSTNNALDQAYTCVKIALNTDDYLGTLKANESNVIPLNSKSSFDTVQIQWFSTKDASGNIDLQRDSKVPLLTSWGGLNPRPPIIRAQFIQFSGSSGFTLGDFDSSIVDNGANTLFLYPSLVGSNSKSLSIDTPRKMPTGNPQSVKCLDSIGANVYSCFAKIKLPIPKLIAGADHTLFLHISSLYNKTDYRITLYDSANLALTVPFNAVQPQIDSTGRANDLFRRVQTRVELTDVNFAYPEAAVDITGSFCKGFSVTDNSADYNNGNVGQITDCKP